MAKGNITTVVKAQVNNSKEPSTVNKSVELVVRDGMLVPDHRELNSGVIQ